MFKFSNLNILLLLAALFAASCDSTDLPATRRLLFDVAADTASPGYDYFPQATSYLISVDGRSFLRADTSGPQADPEFEPWQLVISINKPGDLVPSLLNPFGFRVQTQFSLNEGASTITVNHTNVADTVVVTMGDTLRRTLYAIRGEGIVSFGTGMFEDVSGLFFEQSTYAIDTVDGAPQVVDIASSYELQIEF